MTAPAAQRAWPTSHGRWGVRQLLKGQPTGGGTVNLGWATRAEAVRANPPVGDHTFQPFPRWPRAARRVRLTTP